MIRTAALVATAAFLSVAASVAAIAANSPVAATFKSPAQVDIGTVQVDETPSGMRLRLHLRGLTPGWHAMHVHENGKCGTADFADAGGHLGHDHAAHGRMSPTGPHVGDLPNIYAASDGVANAEVFSERLTLSPARVLPTRGLVSGAAIIVHAKADDDETQPSGNAGARVACALIP